MNGWIPLVLAWLCGAAIFTIFRWLEKLQADTLLVIVINYYVAAAMGWTLAGGWATFEEAWPAPWVLTAMLAGAAFLYLFNLMANAARTIGVTVTSVSAKLSMILPVLIFLLFDPEDGLTWNKTLALLFTLPAIVLSSWTAEQTTFRWNALRIPFIIFLGGGAIDLMFGWFSGPEHMTRFSFRYLFTTIPFTIAGILGTLVLFFRKTKPATPLSPIATTGIGLGLGIINLGSLYFLLESYAQLPFDRSAITPLVNLGIIVLAAAAASILFREKLTRPNIIGLMLALFAIALLAL
jgi:multidrug transporter EmrE-like cation transporter